jgi:hypothetical protein
VPVPTPTSQALGIKEKEQKGNKKYLETSGNGHDTYQNS